MAALSALWQKVYPQHSWKDLQVGFGQQLNAQSQAIAQALGLELRAKTKAEAEQFQYMQLSEVLNLRLAQGGIIGYGAHNVISTSEALRLAVEARDKGLVLYYLLRRGTITARIWQATLRWGSRGVFDALVRCGSEDYLTDCGDITDDLLFVEHLIEHYQRTMQMSRLRWLNRLIGGSLSLEAIAKLELPKIQLLDCLKGMNPEKAALARTKWNIELSPYLAGMSGDPQLYRPYLPQELRSLELVPIDPEAVVSTDSVFYRTESGKNGDVRLPIARGADPEVDRLRALYTDTAVAVFAGLCDRLQRAPKGVSGLVVGRMDHFPRSATPAVASWHPISWYRETLWEGQQKAGKDNGKALRDAADICLRQALLECNLEVLLELQRAYPLDYGFILAKARSPIVADWAFQQINAEGFAFPDYATGIDLDRNDPFFSSVREVHRQHYPSAAYLR